MIPPTTDRVPLAGESHKEVSEMSDIPASSPVVQPAVPAVTYDKWVVESLVFSGDGISTPLSAEAWFRIGTKKADGSWILGDVRRNFHIPNVWELASTDADVAQTMGSVIATLTRLASAAGVL